VNRRAAKLLIPLRTAGLCALLATACERKQTSLEELNLTEAEAREILARASAEARAKEAAEAARLEAKRASATPGPVGAAVGTASLEAIAPTAGGKTLASPSSSILPSTGQTSPSPATTSAGAVQEQVLDPTLVGDTWVADGLVDVAPAAPSVASAEGVVLINSKNELLFARIGALPVRPAAAATPIDPIDDSRGPFALGRGPAIADGYAYWVTSHSLLRRPLRAPHEPMEELAADARVGTRAAALRADAKAGRPTWVGYVALPTINNGPLRMKLWYGQEHEAIVTDPNTSALSVDLLEHAGKVHALFLEARTGQSTLHARTIAQGSPPKMEADRVLWLGGTPNPLTELRTSIDPRGRVLGLLPLEQDATHFSLGVLAFDDLLAQAPPTERWHNYLNGINPAPAIAATFCGKTRLLFARPSTADAFAPQELVMIDADAADASGAVVLGTSKAYYDLSVAPLAGGALLSYVADHRTWARTVRCVKKAG
jgi:hypothetical protein